MNVTSFSVLSQYLYSPHTWIHPISVKYKFFCILIILLSIPLNSSIYIMIIILTFSYITLLNCTNLKYTFKLIKNLYTYCFLLFITYLLNLKSGILNQHIYNIKRYYPLKLILIKRQNFFIYSYDHIVIPKFLLQISFFIYSNIIFMRILFLTTKYEEIIFLLFQYIDKIKNKQFFFIQTLICSLSLASQFIELIIKYFQNKIISLKLRKIYHKIHKYQSYNYLILSFFFDLINDINQICFFIYSREIIINKFYIINI
uniref:Transmembrane protein n=1 Tax=Antithamnionella ternifolia TaxID=207919 RepID=A0A4D6WJ79_9FLOR|nr:hypothetical protein [Antithamnionella ternifolia]